MADELSTKRAQINLDLARTDKDLLKRYTQARDLAQLRSDVSQAQKGLERTQRKATADVVQAEVDLSSESTREALTRFSRQRLERITRWQTEVNLSVLPLSAGEETVPQIRRLLGRLAPRRRVR